MVQLSVHQKWPWTELNSSNTIQWGTTVDHLTAYTKNSGEVLPVLKNLLQLQYAYQLKHL